jgi:hydrogenase-4 component F
MIGVYFIIGLIIAGLILLYPGKRSSLVYSFAFILLQALFSGYALLNRDKVELRYFTYDALAVVFLLLMSLIAAASFYHSIAYVREDSRKKRALFFFSFIALNISLTGVYTANNIIVSWIFIELTTLSAAGLINHNRSLTSLEATWKYVFICSVGIALAYIGILFASANPGAGQTGDMSFESLKSSFAGIDPVYLKIAFVLILTGYSSKLEVFPLYTIGIDANYVAPAPVSAFLSTALVNGGFIAFFRVFASMADSPITEWMNHVLLITGLLSLLASAIYMQKASNLKRVFAYSTVEHMGLVLIALSFGKTGIYIALIQITVHSLIKSGLFIHAGILHRVLKSYKISKTGGYLALNPAGAVILLSGVILITAIPPSGLFLSEFLLFKELAYGHWLVFLTVAVLLTLIFYGIFNKNLRVIMGNPLPAHEKIAAVPFSEYYSQIVFFGLAVLACFYLPDVLAGLFSSISGLDARLPLSVLNLK